jgi:hypothetical protein
MNIYKPPQPARSIWSAAAGCRFSGLPIALCSFKKEPPPLCASVVKQSHPVTSGHVWSRLVTSGHVWSRLVTFGLDISRISQLEHCFEFRISSFEFPFHASTRAKRMECGSSLPLFPIASAAPRLPGSSVAPTFQSQKKSISNAFQ